MAAAAERPRGRARGVRTSQKEPQSTVGQPQLEQPPRLRIRQDLFLEQPRGLRIRQDLFLEQPLGLRIHQDLFPLVTSDINIRQHSCESNNFSLTQEASNIVLDKTNVEKNDSASVFQGISVEQKSAVIENICTPVEYVKSKKGFSGNSVKLTGNIFSLAVQKECLYHYLVDFEPKEESVAIKKGLLNYHKEKFGFYIFDGTTLITDQYDCSLSKLVSVRKKDNIDVQISLQFIEDIKSTNPLYMKFFMIFIKRYFRQLNLIKVGKNFYDPNAKIEIEEHNLEIWPGYIINIFKNENNLLLCTDVTHKILMKGTILNLSEECVNSSSRNYIQLFRSEVIGRVVLTIYNHRTYYIYDVDFNVSPMSTFTLQQGHEISFKDYYEQKYKIKIKDLSQPMLVSQVKSNVTGITEKVYLVPELCQVTGLSKRMQDDFHLMCSLAQHTHENPFQKVNKLIDLNYRFAQNKVQDDLWTFSSKFLEFDGRVLAAEKVNSGRSVTYMNSFEDEFTNILDNCMFTARNIQKWVVMVPGRSKQCTKSFVATLIQVANGMQFRILWPYFYEIKDDSPKTYIEALDHILSEREPQIILCVVSNNRSDRYSEIKKKCCVEFTIPTQIIVAKNILSNKDESFVRKIAIQMYCKTGGAPWTVDIPVANCMVIGLDKCHDTSNQRVTYCALVVSLEKNLSRYHNVVFAHKSSEEFDNLLIESMTKAFQVYRRYNGSLPHKIIFYCSSTVGDGMVDIYTHIVDILKKNVIDIHKRPADLSFIVVNKQRDVRLFSENNNPCVGTVADDVVTYPDRHDFFLVSTASKGTVCPTYYHVISDNVGLDPDKIQRFTYKLTHLYYNWSGTIRIPAPVQYAHKLASLTGEALHHVPNDNWDTRMYFL